MNPFNSAGSSVYFACLGLIALYRNEFKHNAQETAPLTAAKIIHGLVASLWQPMTTPVLEKCPLFPPSLPTSLQNLFSTIRWNQFPHFQLHHWCWPPCSRNDRGLQFLSSPGVDILVTNAVMERLDQRNRMGTPRIEERTLDY